MELSELLNLPQGDKEEEEEEAVVVFVDAAAVCSLWEAVEEKEAKTVEAGEIFLKGDLSRALSRSEKEIDFFLKI